MNDQINQVRELIQQLDIWEKYFRSTVIPQLYVDGELKLRKYTPPAMTQFNLLESDLGKSIIDMTDNFRFSGISENIQYVIDHDESLEKEVQTTDLHWYQMNILPIAHEKDYKSDGVVITFIEITRRIKDLKALETIVADNGILLDTLSHDLRNPIANLEAAMNMFLSASPENREEFTTLHTIAVGAMKSLQKLILELTEVRKAAWAHTDEELLDFENILEDVELILKDNIAAFNARITHDIQVSQLTFSRRKLRTVMYNFLNNALKFRSAERQPQIDISTREMNNHIIISVRDNGIGIKEGNIDQIFSKYHRLDDSIEGSGIGLYLVKEIVCNAGGRIEVQSQFGKGTEFRVYLKADEHRGLA